MIANLQQALPEIFRARCVNIPKPFPTENQRVVRMLLRFGFDRVPIAFRQSAEFIAFQTVAAADDVIVAACQGRFREGMVVKGWLRLRRVKDSRLKQPLCVCRQYSLQSGRAGLGMTDMKDQMRQAVASVSVGRKEHRDDINIDVLLQPQQRSQSQCPAPPGVRQSLSAVRRLFNDRLSRLPAAFCDGLAFAARRGEGSVAAGRGDPYKDDDPLDGNRGSARTRAVGGIFVLAGAPARLDGICTARDHPDGSAGR